MCDEAVFRMIKKRNEVWLHDTPALHEAMYAEEGQRRIFVGKNGKTGEERGMERFIRYL